MTDINFVIPEENMSRFEERMAALVKRAGKLGCPVPSYRIVATREITVREGDLDGETFLYVATVHDVTVSGEAPSYAGWSFVAVRDHAEGGEPIIRKCGEIEVPERFRAANSHCEHCRTSRRRSETFVLRHEDGRWIQVGRSCIRDFLGHDSPESIAAAAEMIAEMLGGGAFSDLDGEGRAAYTPTITTYLNFVACVIRHHGWCSRKRAHDDEYAGIGGTSTASIAMTWMLDRAAAARRGERTCKYPQPSETDRQRATEAREWAANLSGDLSDYEHNIRAAAKRESLPERSSGLVASIIPAWDRDCAKKRDRAVSQFVGALKERLRGLRLTVERVIPLDGVYGTSYINVMRDDCDNVFTWKASGKALETGCIYTVTGTVKAHKEFRGVAQTELTRCVAVRVLFEGEEVAA